mmetsp:Transcript_3243/g.4796  ORF Transcript_3243/g.4796 Transcript_3243/m.4796 type:complete len:256 (-) Transcript_3243:929-1696(-)|eukprot:CAMPEP_0118676522 /NCGR_PEP_ID=MMETSP0800-20121206/2096_1 /TAXON_ID=210618 ORGANISM="Striatella unipunctata, Strain CCMP2910" /NCGR_SAMPLE_ID=MMETSP0800 /ASSEMBLY_ACC=CAM_ASM_000638 /LENGTH=255 /DNA_ID=CAMNT_0006572049 /DNA_START=85 /DNA_END=852 /DNA_ORIENTATION=+
MQLQDLQIDDDDDYFDAGEVADLTPKSKMPWDTITKFFSGNGFCDGFDPDDGEGDDLVKDGSLNNEEEDLVKNNDLDKKSHGQGPNQKEKPQGILRPPKKRQSLRIKEQQLKQAIEVTWVTLMLTIMTITMLKILGFQLDFAIRSKFSTLTSRSFDLQQKYVSITDLPVMGNICQRYERAGRLGFCRSILDSVPEKVPEFVPTMIPNIVPEMVSDVHVEGVPEAVSENTEVPKMINNTHEVCVIEIPYQEDTSLN